MTGAEMLKALSITGEIEEADLNEELNGFLGWNVGFENGNSVLTIRFESEDSNLSLERKWILTPVEARGGFRV